MAWKNRLTILGGKYKMIATVRLDAGHFESKRFSVHL